MALLMALLMALRMAPRMTLLCADLGFMTSTVTLDTSVDFRSRVMI